MFDVIVVVGACTVYREVFFVGNACGVVPSMYITACSGLDVMIVIRM